MQCGNARAWRPRRLKGSRGVPESARTFHEPFNSENRACHTDFNKQPFTEPDVPKSASAAMPIRTLLHLPELQLTV